MDFVDIIQGKDKVPSSRVNKSFVENTKYILNNVKWQKGSSLY